MASAGFIRSYHKRFLDSGHGTVIRVGMPSRAICDVVGSEINCHGTYQSVDMPSRAIFDASGSNILPLKSKIHGRQQILLRSGRTSTGERSKLAIVERLKLIILMCAAGL